jgi:hypothetical protein
MVSATDVEDGFMSEVQQRPGWWQAADWRWYPPELHPDFQSRRFHTSAADMALEQRADPPPRDYPLNELYTVT